MIKWNRFFASVTMAALLLAGCGNQVSAEQASDEPQVETTLPQIDATKWNYNAEDGVYWQVGISYCENPADLTYETLGIFVPEAYMTAEENGDGTYTCTINTNGTAENYTAQTAPIVIPVNTPGYMAMEAPTEYVEAAADYTDAGFIYVNAGCRGRLSGGGGKIPVPEAEQFLHRVCVEPDSGEHHLCPQHQEISAGCPV